MAFPYLLLAMQGAGIAANLYSQDKQRRAQNKALDQQSRFSDIGYEIADKELGFRMEQEQLASTERSIFDLENLREVMASNRALTSARGQMPGVGSAGSVSNRNINLYNQDQKARQLSEGFKKFQMESNSRLLRLNQTTKKASIANYKMNQKAERKASLLKFGLNMFDFNSTVGNIGNMFGG